MKWMRSWKVQFARQLTELEGSCSIVGCWTLFIACFSFLYWNTFSVVVVSVFPPLGRGPRYDWSYSLLLSVISRSTTIKPCHTLRRLLVHVRIIPRATYSRRDARDHTRVDFPKLNSLSRQTTHIHFIRNVKLHHRVAVAKYEICEALIRVLSLTRQPWRWKEVEYVKKDRSPASVICKWESALKSLHCDIVFTFLL